MAPANRQEMQRCCLTEEISFFMLSDLTEIFDVRVGLYHWVNFLGSQYA